MKANQCGSSKMNWLGTLRSYWHGLREAKGNDAYERYLAHWHEHHATENDPPMDRKTFFKQEMERKWNGVKRCC